ncbi:MAG: AAA family ATPase, partial [Lachnospiraceae bacterium]|nr:AAA family ATPase [Lachnospiraceae bacterium]
MYLKSIEVVGFKSFANKIDFQFHNGITCIVGPNGSGKSNVADAVRWVLGEQSAKQLRGANMSDVIFSGTEMRKPQGYASVAITLDNSDHRLPIDYEEVTVSRKVFRSGESEYKINGVITRLKDIQELFYDTGIGKEGYSIIGQGQIDRILSNKPEERRELFDEAAGIVKYKRRKKETLKKLENVHANLLRVTDILSELEKQVGPLERQSENAKKFLALRDELKTFDFRLFAKDYEQGEEKLKEIEDNLEIVISNIETQNQANKSLLDEYEEVNTSIDRLDDLIKESSKAARDSESNAQDKQSRILVINEQINSENIVLSHTEERLGKILEEQQRHQKDRESVNQSLSENGAREYELANKEYDSTNILAAL